MEGDDHFKVSRENCTLKSSSLGTPRMGILGHNPSSPNTTPFRPTIAAIIRNWVSMIADLSRGFSDESNGHIIYFPSI